VSAIASQASIRLPCPQTRLRHGLLAERAVTAVSGFPFFGRERLIANHVDTRLDRDLRSRQAPTRIQNRLRRRDAHPAFRGGTHHLDEDIDRRGCVLACEPSNLCGLGHWSRRQPRAAVWRASLPSTCFRIFDWTPGWHDEFLSARQKA